MVLLTAEGCPWCGHPLSELAELEQMRDKVGQAISSLDEAYAETERLKDALYEKGELLRSAERDLTKLRIENQQLRAALELG